MSELRRRYCIFGCDALVTYGVPLHQFPNPDNRPDLFATWIAAVGSKVTESDRKKMYKSKRICDHHFDPAFKATGGRLICSAIPTVNLNRVQQTICTFVETDHSYCRPRRESGHARPLIDITNLPGPSRFGPSSAVDSTEFSAPSGSTCLMSSEKCHARTPLMKFDEGVQQTICTFVETDHSYCGPRRESGHARPLIDITNLPGPSRFGPSSAVDSTEFSAPSGPTCLMSSEKCHARTPLMKFDEGVQQTICTFVETDYSYCGPRSESGHARPLIDITNLPGPSRSGLSPAIDSTEFSEPSGSTCLMSSEKCHTRTPLMKFDEGKTFEYLQKKAETQCARKARPMQNEVRRLRQKVKTLKLRIKQVKNKIANRDFAKLSRNMSESAKLFTRMQCIEGRKKKKGHRFTQEEKILSLSIFKKSPKAYKLMCKHFTLPSKKVLKSLLAQIKLTPGINEIVFKELKSTVSKMLQQDRLCTLVFDEMSIAPQIHYNVYTDNLIGFENYGNCKTQNFANHILVFMVKGVRKNYKQPVAYYFTQTLKTSKLKEILVDVVTNVLATGLKIIATVCDQSSANVSTINSLISETKTAYLQAGKEWRKDIINVNNHEIIPLFDVPHLLKGIRNNLLNKEMHYMHENVLKIVKWEYFQRVFEADKSHGELRMLPNLTSEHIDPGKIKKMRVKNAAQVLSYSMAVATDNLIVRGDCPSECRDLIPFLLIIDKLFDLFNASSFTPPNGKIFKAAVKRNSPHHTLWQDAIKMLKTAKFMVIKSDEETVEKSVPTLINLIRTIEGFKSIWQLLSKKYSFDAMLTRNFNQDPLENFFGSVRSLGARNVMPNCVGFEGAFKTLFLNNFSTNHSVSSNCEEDSNECLQSLSFFLKNKKISIAPLQSQSIVIDQPLNVMKNSRNISDSGTDQRTYVCGWALTKCLQKVVKGCKICKSKLLGNSDSKMYKYINAREYCQNKKWLCYPSDCLVACFQEIQETTVAFLNNDCHKKNIKERIKTFIDLFTDFSFIDCKTHRDKLKQCFVDTSINIIIYSWCRSINRILDGKITYEGEDSTKKAAQMYFNKYKTYKY